MRRREKVLLLSWGIVLSLFVIIQSAYSQEYPTRITEEYLRSQFVFLQGEKIKYSKCDKKSPSRCKYVWGVESKKDATRAKHGLVPGGNTLMVIYAPAKGMKDFQRVVSSYPDAKEIADVCVKAVWSPKRKQLSCITDKSLIIHVNLSGVAKVHQAGEKAISIARHIAEGL